LRTADAVLRQRIDGREGCAAEREEQRQIRDEVAAQVVADLAHVPLLAKS
jgi:hypothetical protein